MAKRGSRVQPVRVGWLPLLLIATAAAPTRAQAPRAVALPVGPVLTLELAAGEAIRVHFAGLTAATPGFVHFGANAGTELRVIAFAGDQSVGDAKLGTSPALLVRPEAQVEVRAAVGSAVALQICARLSRTDDRRPELAARIAQLTAELQRHTARFEPVLAGDLALVEGPAVLEAARGALDLDVANALSLLSGALSGAGSIDLAAQSIALARSIASSTLPDWNRDLLDWRARQPALMALLRDDGSAAVRLAEQVEAQCLAARDPIRARRAIWALGIAKGRSGDFAGMRSDMLRFLASPRTPVEVRREFDLQIAQHIALADAVLGHPERAQAGLTERLQAYPVPPATGAPARMLTAAVRLLEGTRPGAEPHRPPPADSAAIAVLLPAATPALPAGFVETAVAAPPCDTTWTLAVGAVAAEADPELLVTDDRGLVLSQPNLRTPYIAVELPAGRSARVLLRNQWPLQATPARLHLLARAEPPAAKAILDRVRAALDPATTSVDVDGVLAELPTELPPSLALITLLDALQLRIPAKGSLPLRQRLRTRAQELAARLLPSDHPLRYVRLQAYAADATLLGDLRGAIEHRWSFLDGLLANVPLAARDLPSSFATLAVHCRDTGDERGLRRAMEWTRDALASTPSPRFLDLEVRHLLAALHTDYGEPLEGLRLMTESLAAVAGASTPDLQNQVLQRLADHCADLGDLAGAAAMLREVDERLQAAGNPADMALRERIATRLAAMTTSSIDVDGAAARLAAVSADADPDSESVVEAKELLASRMLFAARFAAALPIQREVVDHRDRVGDARARWLARGNLAAILSGAGQHAAARGEFARVVRAVERLVPDHHPGLVLALRYAAWNLGALDADASQDLADLLERMLAAALAGLEHERPCAQPRRLELVAAAAAPDVGTALALQGKVPDAQRPSLLAAAFTLQETARALASDVFALRRRLVTTPGPAARTALEQMGVIAAELARLQTNGGDGFGNVMRILAVERQQQELAGMLQDVPGAAELCTPITVAAVQAQLLAGDAAVSFVRWQRAPLPAAPTHPVADHYAAFVVRRDAELACIDLGSATAIDEAIDGWRTAADDHAGFRAQSLKLHGLVLQPVHDVLGPTRRLFVVPDDALHLVAFDVLAAIAGGPDLGCVRCASLRQIAADDAPAPTAPRLLAFGGVDYGASHTNSAATADAAASRLRGLPTAALLDDPGDFAPLPHTAAEVAQVAAQFRARFGDAAAIDLRRGDGATKQALLDRAPGCDYLHVATHGYVGESVAAGPGPADLRRALLDDGALAGISPASLCGLAFAAANTAAASQTRLTAAELAWLDLSRCRLAVLSSCESTLGVRLAGRGIASLQTALHRAGVQTSVAALWAVDDRATAEFMQRFYRHLWAHGRSPEAALRLARTDLMAQLRPDGSPRWTPRDCAAWVLVRG